MIYKTLHKKQWGQTWSTKHYTKNNEDKQGSTKNYTKNNEDKQWSKKNNKKTVCENIPMIMKRLFPSKNC
jgi:uncharacterized membrane protein YkgB